MDTRLKAGMTIGALSHFLSLCARLCLAQTRVPLDILQPAWHGQRKLFEARSDARPFVCGADPTRATFVVKVRCYEDQELAEIADEASPRQPYGASSWPRLHHQQNPGSL